MARSVISARLARKWRAAPDDQVQAIIRTVADLNEVSAIVEQRGLTIVRRFSLLPALAIRGVARDVLALSGEDWITRVEEDRQVHTTP
jgi:hypothetical protein